VYVRLDNTQPNSEQRLGYGVKLLITV